MIEELTGSPLEIREGAMGNYFLILYSFLMTYLSKKNIPIKGFVTVTTSLKIIF
jgi:hypothetical protein